MRLEKRLNEIVAIPVYRKAMGSSSANSHTEKGNLCMTYVTVTMLRKREDSSPLLAHTLKIGKAGWNVVFSKSYLTCSTTMYFQKRILPQAAHKKLEPYYPNAPRNRPKDTVQTHLLTRVLSGSISGRHSPEK